MLVKTSHQELKDLILFQKSENAKRKQELLEELEVTISSMTPVNIIKKSIGSLISKPGLVDGVVDSGLGLVAGFLSKRILVGSSGGAIKNIIGSLVQLGVSTAVAKNAHKLKILGSHLIDSVSSKKVPQD